MSALLARHRLGRVLLHLACCFRGGQLKFHLAGIAREFTR
jgi:hypothetical protein